MHVTGHKVLITGGSSGIGFALARELLARENDVFITARGADRLQAAARQLPGAAAECSDVSDERSLRTLVDTAVGAMGGLTMLVNNAGVQFNDRYGETETETVLRHVEEEIGTNLLGLVKLTALAVPHLRQQPDSAVVNVSSLLAIAPKQSAPVYCATKAAVTSFSQSLRYQLEEISPPIRVFDVLAAHRDVAFDLIKAPFGAGAYFDQGKAFPDETKTVCDSADAISPRPAAISPASMWLARVRSVFADENRARKSFIPSACAAFRVSASSSSAASRSPVAARAEPRT